MAEGMSAYCNSALDDEIHANGTCQPFNLAHWLDGRLLLLLQVRLQSINLLLLFGQLWFLIFIDNHLFRTLHLFGQATHVFALAISPKREQRVLFLRLREVLFLKLWRFDYALVLRHVPSATLSRVWLFGYLPAAQYLTKGFYYRFRLSLSIISHCSFLSLKTLAIPETLLVTAHECLFESIRLPKLRSIKESTTSKLTKCACYVSAFMCMMSCDFHLLKLSFRRELSLALFNLSALYFQGRTIDLCIFAEVNVLSVDNGLVSPRGWENAWKQSF